MLIYGRVGDLLAHIVFVFFFGFVGALELLEARSGGWSWLRGCGGGMYMVRGDGGLRHE